MHACAPRSIAESARTRTRIPCIYSKHICHDPDTYRARPYYCVIPHIVQGMQFSGGVIVHMQEWWPCEHMFYVGCGSVTCDIVRLGGGAWRRAIDTTAMVRVHERKSKLGQCCCARGVASSLQRTCCRRLSVSCALTSDLSELAEDSNFVAPLPYDVNDFQIINSNIQPTNGKS